MDHGLAKQLPFSEPRPYPGQVVKLLREVALVQSEASRLELASDGGDRTREVDGTDSKGLPIGAAEEGPGECAECQVLERQLDQARAAVAELQGDIPQLLGHDTSFKAPGMMPSSLIMMPRLKPQTVSSSLRQGLCPGWYAFISVRGLAQWHLFVMPKHICQASAQT